MRLRTQKAAELMTLTSSPWAATIPRRLEIFLDVLANESDQGWQHVLDDAFVTVLEGPEVALRQHVQTLIEARPVLEGGGAWPAVEAMLRRFGWEGPAAGVGELSARQAAHSGDLEGLTQPP